MTFEQKEQLEKKLKDFNSFKEFHSYAYKHNIIFDNDEWQDYSNKMKNILREKENSCIYIDTTGLILPNTNKD